MTRLSLNNPLKFTPFKVKVRRSLMTHLSLNDALKLIPFNVSV